MIKYFYIISCYLKKKYVHEIKFYHCLQAWGWSDFVEIILFYKEYCANIYSDPTKSTRSKRNSQLPSYSFMNPLPFSRPQNTFWYGTSANPHLEEVKLWSPAWVYLREFLSYFNAYAILFKNLGVVYKFVKMKLTNYISKFYNFFLKVVFSQK